MTRDIWIIIPAHNRKRFTLGCLEHLRGQGLREKMRVLVVDDGSTDGTPAAVAENHPGVEIVRGDGNLYWTGAIALGMRHAMERGAQCMVWLNDDAVPHDNAIERVADRAMEIGGIVSGQGFVDMGSKRGRWLFPVLHRGMDRLVSIEVIEAKGISEADTCRGNLVAVARRVVERIGYPDGTWIPHVNGDTDYGLRATAAGLPCEVMCDALIEELDTRRQDNRSWLLGEAHPLSIWRRLLRKNHSAYPPMWAVYNVRHFGWRGALRIPGPYARLAMATVARCLIPRPWLIRIYGSRSHAWKAYEWEKQRS